MAAQTAVYCQHATLSGTTADSVTLSGTGETLAVTNRDASVTLYFTIGGATAVAAADETYVVLPLQTKVLGARLKDGRTVVSVVGNGNAYSVEIF